MKSSILFSLMVVSTLLISCKTAVTTTGQPRPNMVELVNNPETTIVDVRISGEFEQSTAKNAVNIPLAEIENNLDFFRKQKQTVLFCNRGIQAQQAIDILRKHGIENVYSGKTLDNVNAIQQKK